MNATVMVDAVAVAGSVVAVGCMVVVDSVVVAVVPVLVTLIERANRDATLLLHGVL